eukprot:TRINITY_DN11757_c0_g1_i2.p2 TRINITY_DN11757_c0_g1~~TRINITY_DN11757_c0_g1_i2.p2  ORF type:complete len:107 (-),score=10.23 TRINITY_DN11757_c0_g1_i2:401-721(-)
MLFCSPHGGARLQRQYKIPDPTNKTRLPTTMPTTRATTLSLPSAKSVLVELAGSLVELDQCDHGALVELDQCAHGSCGGGGVDDVKVTQHLEKYSPGWPAAPVQTS